MTTNKAEPGIGFMRSSPNYTTLRAWVSEGLLSQEAAGRGLTWLIDRVEDGTWREPAPIGFYFARLWYFERLYPLIFTVGALRQGRHRLQHEVNHPE